MLIRARLPHREVRRFAPYLVAEARDGAGSVDADDRAADHAAARRRRSAARRPTPATPASTSRPASSVTLGPGERALVGTGLAVAIPEGYAGFVQPRSGLAARHGITIVNSPGPRRLGLPRRAARRPAQHRPREPFAVEPGMRIAQLVVLPVPAVELLEVDELAESERGVRGFGSSAH